MKRHAHSSPKLADLKVRLGLKQYQAVGLLEALWHFTATQAPRGDIGRWTDQQIAAALEWEGDPTEMIGELVESKWLDRCADHRLLVHDWKTHADQGVKRSPLIQSEGFAKLRLVSDASDTSAALDSLSLSPEPEPEPDARGDADASVGPEPDLEAAESRKPEKPPDLKAQVREIWPQCQRAAKGYGRRWDTLGDARLEAMAARLQEHRTRGPTVLVEAIHGYVLARRPREPDQNSFDWRRYCAPETIYQRSKFALYVEAFDEQQAEAIAQSRAPPREPPTEEVLSAIQAQVLSPIGSVDVPPEAKRVADAQAARILEGVTK